MTSKIFKKIDLLTKTFSPHPTNISYVLLNELILLECSKSGRRAQHLRELRLPSTTYVSI